MQTTLSFRTNRDLFSNHYLDEHLPETEAWDQLTEDELREAKDDILELWNREKSTAPKRNESQLEERFIRPMFRKLGIPFEVEESTSRTQRRPDYAFFETKEAAKDAFERREEGGDFYQNAVAVADAKRWGRPLDTRGSAEYERNFENPSYQIHVYLQETPTRWAVLTDGKRWRLYYGPTSHRLDSYYEVDLPTILEGGDLEDFKYFYLFFRHGAFIEDASGDCFLDEVYDESNVFAQELGADLQDNIYEAIKVLSEGFLDYPDNDLSPEDLDRIHDSSLIYLYRLIFVLYAEAEGRELLDTNNEIYEASYSLNSLKKDIAEELDSADPKYRDWQNNLWSRLDELFKLIDQGSNSRGIPEEDLYIPAYNGGLFRTAPDEDGSPEAQFLAEHEVGDAYLARVIELVTRSRNGNGSGKIFVDYSSLDVRHLGSIYEGLLEYKLNIAEEPLALDDGEYVSAGDGEEVAVDPGELYLTTNSGERKATGSYYTPEYIVEYIVENTLGPLVGKIREALAGQSAYDEGGFASEFADQVFELKVLDPAMGSGHFLTNAVDYLAREIIDAQERQAAQEGIETVDEKHDINWARRQVAQRCIYGVDLNPLAVELAKVSLWLRTLAAEQPLAFLDHHLKMGNSLIGVDLEDIQELESPDVEGGPNSQLTDFGVTQKGSIENLLSLHQSIVSSENETLEDIKFIERKYEEFEEDELRNRLEAIANVRLFDLYGETVPETSYSKLAESIEDDDDWGELSDADWFRGAQELAGGLKPIHYRLEFPDVFYTPDVSKSGFDAIIGNPPYVGEKNRKSEFEVLKKVSLVRHCYHGRMDMLYFFVQLGVDLLNESGRTSMITTAYWPEADSAEELRKNITEDAWLEELLHFGDYTIFEDARGQQNQIHQITRKEPEKARIAFLDDTSISEETLSEHLMDDLEAFYYTDYDIDKLDVPTDGSPWTGLKELARGPIEFDTTGGAIGDYLTSKQGIVPNPDTVTSRSYEKFQNEAIEVGEGVYLLNDQDLDRIGITPNHPLLRPAYRNSNIKEYWIDYPDNLYLLYITSADEVDEYPRIKQHLQRYRAKLEDRREVQNGKIAWYSIHWPREETVFKTAKIVYSNWGNDWQPFAVEDKGYYERRDITLLKPEDDWVNLYAAVALLNSSISRYLLTESSTRTGYSTQASVEDVPAKRDLLENEQVEQIAREIESSMEKRASEINGFYRWIETEWEVDLESLSRKTYLKEYWKYEFDDEKGLLEVAKHNLGSIAPDPSARLFQLRMEEEYSDSVSRIYELDKEVAKYKANIDQIVFDSLGVPETDIERIYEQLDLKKVREHYVTLNQNLGLSNARKDRAPSNLGKFRR